MKNEEIWKDVVGYEGYYQVSSIGRLRSIDVLSKNKNGVIWKRSGVEIKPQFNRYGYYSYTMYKDGLRGRILAHRLVAMMFVPNPDNKPCIDHINTVKTDNRVENLKWVTPKENSNNALTKSKISKAKTGRKLPPHQILAMSLCRKGVKPSRQCYEARLKTSRVPVVQLDKKGNVIGEYESQMEASRMTGCDPTSINKALKGKMKFYKQSKWIYRHEYYK